MCESLDHFLYMWSPKTSKSIGERTSLLTNNVSTIPWFEDGFKTNLGRTRVIQSPKQPPKSNPNRPRNNQKTTSKSTSILDMQQWWYNTKSASMPGSQGCTLVRPPPREAPQGPGGARATRHRLPGTHAHAKRA